MKGEWCYFKNHFSKSTCDTIVQTIKTRPYEDAVIGVDTNTLAVDKDFRRSRIRFVQQHDTELGWLFDELWRLGSWANRDWFNFHISKLDYYQIAEYDSSYLGEYKQHHDVFYINNDPFYHRKLSCIIQLTDPNEYEGGNLEFYNLSNFPNSNDLRQQGTVIFFPSFLLHAATKVTKGTRYSLAAWFDGPKWR